MGLGSDHTDRVLEAVSVHKSKQVCLKPIAHEIWPLEEVIDHWDDIELCSWVTVHDNKCLYQSGRLNEFLPPDQLIKILEERGYTTPGMAVFCGTLPLINGQFLYGKTFQAELRDKKINRSITLVYHIKQLKDVEGE